MEDFFCDSYCGLFCGACEIQNAYKNSLETGKIPNWNDLPEIFRNNISKAEIKCNGCKSESVFAGCSKCKIRACAKKRNVDYCINCTDFPCEKTNEMKRNLLTLSSYLPHTKAILSNLEIIKNIGSELWIQKEKEKWSCNNCGNTITWYQIKCDKCNSDIRNDCK